MTIMQMQSKPGNAGEQPERRLRINLQKRWQRGYRLFDLQGIQTRINPGSTRAEPSQQISIKIGSALIGLASCLTSLAGRRIRDWYSSKHRTVDKKILEEYAAAGKTYIPEEDDDNNTHNEDQDDGFILQ